MNEATCWVVIGNEIIHFRPLARLRELCGRLQVDVRLSFRGDTLSVSNILALTGWELSRGDKVLVEVRGHGDVEAALRTIAEFIEKGFGEAV